MTVEALFNATHIIAGDFIERTSGKFLLNAHARNVIWEQSLENGGRGGGGAGDRTPKSLMGKLASSPEKSGEGGGGCTLGENCTEYLNPPSTIPATSKYYSA